MVLCPNRLQILAICQLKAEEASCFILANLENTVVTWQLRLQDLSLCELDAVDFPRELNLGVCEWLEVECLSDLFGHLTELHRGASVVRGGALALTTIIGGRLSTILEFFLVIQYLLR